MDVLDIFLPFAPFLSKGLHPDMYTNVELTKYKEPSSPALCSENLTWINKNNQSQLYAKKQDTVLLSTLPDKIGRKKLKFSEVIKPRQALEFEVLPL